jgi:DNA-binding NarL/FixJ family response regulator
MWTTMRAVTTRHTVILADDHAGILENASRLLAANYDILATVNDGRKAVEAVLRLSPDVAVLDIAMPELDGFGAAREVKQNWSDTRIVFLTVHDDQDFIAAALASGVNGYVLKPFMQTDLILAIEDALEGRVFVSTHAVKQ